MIPWNTYPLDPRAPLDDQFICRASVLHLLGLDFLSLFPNYGKTRLLRRLPRSIPPSSHPHTHSMAACATSLPFKCPVCRITHALLSLSKSSRRVTCNMNQSISSLTPVRYLSTAVWLGWVLYCCNSLSFNSISLCSRFFLIFLGGAHSVHVG